MNLPRSVLLAAAALCLNPAANAATAVTSTTVEAMLEASCNVSATPMEFGTFNPFKGEPDGMATISSTCTNGTLFDLHLDAGTGLGATTAKRRMTHAGSGSLLDYEMYSDPARTERWGDELKVDTVVGEGSGSVQQFVVYGRIPDPRMAEVGVFSDTITVTVSY